MLGVSNHAADVHGSVEVHAGRLVPREPVGHQTRVRGEEPPHDLGVVRHDGNPTLRVEAVQDLFLLWLRITGHEEPLALPQPPGLGQPLGLERLQGLVDGLALDPLGGQAAAGDGAAAAEALELGVLDDALLVRSAVELAGPASVLFRQQVLRVQDATGPLAVGSVKVACLDAAAFRPRRLPDWIRGGIAR